MRLLHHLEHVFKRLLGMPTVDGGRGQHAGARMPVFIVVPVRECSAERPRVLLRPEPLRKLRLVLHRLELRL